MSGRTSFDFAELTGPLRYKLLVGLVVPRPIAFVSSQDKVGRLNAAPFSFFNVFSESPPLLMIGVEGNSKAADGLKDTARNIASTREFVVNLVDEAMMGAMNIAAVDMPADLDELTEARLTACPSNHIVPPGIAEAPARLECRLWQMIPVGDAGRRLILGEVLGVSVREGVVDPKTYRTDIDRLNTIGRLHGGGNYLRMTNRVVMPRIDSDTWKAS